MTKTLIPNNYRLHIAKQFQESVSEVSNTAYYLYVGDSAPHESGVAKDAYDTNRETVIDAYRNMIMGKRVTPNDISLVVKYIPYVSNTVYAMYDDTDVNLPAKDYFVVVNASSYHHVFKCLSNDNGNSSEIEPDFTHISGANTSVYKTSDNYIWKYMYTVSNTLKNKFFTTELFPVVSNSTVVASAIYGAIDVMKVEDAGKRYDNYITGTFSTSDLRLEGSQVLYNISNSTVSAVNGFYTGCSLYLSTGTGSGQNKQIVDYYSNANGNFISIDTAFDVPPLNDTQYQIYPGVKIIGSGSQTVNAVARAIVNSYASNSISRIEILDRGVGYDYIAASVIANNVVTESSNFVVANIRPIYSPNGGHGFDPAKELNSNSICIAVTLANNESNTIPTVNDYQQVGLIKDPLFNNVDIKLYTYYGNFTDNEQVYKLNPIRLDANVSINTTSNVITSSTADFANQLKANDVVYIKSANSFVGQLATVSSVTSNTELVLSTDGVFTDTEASLYQPNISSNAYVVSSTGTNILVSNVAGVFVNGDYIIGVSSSASAYVNTTSRSGVTKGFDTFVQMYKYIGNNVSGTFTNNEKVYQTSLETSNATLHSATLNGSNVTIYTSNQIGSFVAGNTVIGNESDATALINNVYAPELSFGSGEVLYLNNIEAVTRANGQTETFKIIFEF